MAKEAQQKQAVGEEDTTYGSVNKICVAIVGG